MTVGADGVRSTVAGLVRTPVVRQGKSFLAVLYRYVSGLLADGYEWAYGDGAAAGLIPTNDGDTCVFVSTTRQRMGALRRAGTEHAFSTLLTQSSSRAVDRVGVATPAGRVRGWGDVPGHLRRSWEPG